MAVVLRRKMNSVIRLFLLASFLFHLILAQDMYFDDEDNFVFSSGNLTRETRFLLYDVNSGEGFNLRKDVYIRAANLVKYMNQKGYHWILVLPPWRHLNHWQSPNVQQEALHWRNFFDIQSLDHYVPVMEFEDFMKYVGSNGIDHILYLQHHPEGSEVSNVSTSSANSYERKLLIETARCRQRFEYYLDNRGRFRGYFWNSKHVFAKKHDCVSVQGHVTILSDFVNDLNAKSVLVERLSHLSHMDYGSVDFYRARRSLVFARHLRNVADMFRLKKLQSNDEDDGTHYEEDWRHQIPLDGHAKGGPYIGVHMRRGNDFVQTHHKALPSIEEIAVAVNDTLKKYKLSMIYLATDAKRDEIEEFRGYFTKAKVFRFPRTKSILDKYKDGGIAIIDQWIVAHARHFIGTFQSTFSHCIQEERDILGFNEDTSYNCVCSNQAPKGTCEQPARWRVKYG